MKTQFEITISTINLGMNPIQSSKLVIGQ